MPLPSGQATTVRDVMDLDLIRAAEPTVVCGQDALDRPVRWVHVGEIPDIARFLVGGEVVLTAGLGIGPTEREQGGYVASLAAAGVAALVVEVAGRAFRVLPAPLIRAAQEADLPVIATAREFSFEAVTAELHRRIVNERVDLLEAVENISHRFEELVANDGDYAAIVALLAELAGAPVVLENAARQVRAYAGGDAGSDDLLTAWAAHSRTEHAAHEPGCLRVPVLLRGEPWGHLHVLPGGPAPVVLPYAAERAGTFIAIALLNDRVARAHRTLRQNALLNRLLVGELAAPEFVKLALGLGTDLRGGPVLGVALAPDPAGPAGGPSGPGGPGGTEQADLVALGLRRDGFAVLAGEQSDCSLLVVGLGRSRSAAQVRAVLDGAGVIAGISAEQAAERVRAAVQQARQAFTVSASGVAGPVLAHAELGLYGLLAELADGPQLAQFVEAELGPLMGPEETDGRSLLPTLSAYVETGFNKAEAAARLHIQRRTFYYRLDKIAAALGHDLDAPDTRVRLHVALAGLRLLRARSARDGAG